MPTFCGCSVSDPCYSIYVRKSLRFTRKHLSMSKDTGEDTPKTETGEDTPKTESKTPEQLAAELEKKEELAKNQA